MQIFFTIFAVSATLAAINCALVSSPDLHNVPWLPKAIATWANEYPAFRNFPAFGVVAMSFYFCVLSCLEHFHLRRLLGLAFFCSIVVSIFGVLLECLQILLPTRFFDPYDIAWSIAGAFAGSILASLVSICLIGRR
jgi:hypothetical protein